MNNPLISIIFSVLVIHRFDITFAKELKSSSSPPLPKDVHHLERINIIKEGVTLSGFSAGSSMATQLFVAHSSQFSGVGLFGQVYYRCGPRSLVEFAIRCSKRGLDILPYDLEEAIEDVNKYKSQGLIDDPRRYSGFKKVFVWAAGQDEYLQPYQVKQNIDFYRRVFNLPYKELLLSYRQDKLHVEEKAKHLFPTDNFGAPCDQEAEENLYLGNCAYSGAYESLAFIVPIKLKKPGPFDVAVQSQLKVFDQTEFYEGTNISDIGMGAYGHIYIPKRCESASETCFLHFNFHGCNEWPLDVGRNYSIHSGFLEVAELNEIIVVFPLTTATPKNMNGCWDFFGYTDDMFATKNGQQIKVIMNMYNRLLYGRPETVSSTTTTTATTTTTQNPLIGLVI